MRFSTLLALAALAGLFVWAQGVNRRAERAVAPLSGRAQAIDGDSLIVGGRRIRIKGIDAPEFAQTCRRDGLEYRCGRDAQIALRRLIDDGETLCRGDDHDRFGRLLAVCAVNGEDIGARMVRDGLAISYGDYLIEEARARADRKGLWAGEFQTPREWRDAHPRNEPAAPPIRPDPPTPRPRS